MSHSRTITQLPLASSSLENESEYMWLNSEIKILRKYCKFYTYLISKLNIVLVITLSAFQFWYIK